VERAERENIRGRKNCEPCGCCSGARGEQNAAVDVKHVVAVVGKHEWMSMSKLPRDERHDAHFENNGKHGCECAMISFEARELLS